MSSGYFGQRGIYLLPRTMGEGARLFLAGESKSREHALLYLIPFLALIFTGAGRLSIDGLVWPRWRERREKRKASALR